MKDRHLVKELQDMRELNQKLVQENLKFMTAAQELATAHDHTLAVLISVVHCLGTEDRMILSPEQMDERPPDKFKLSFEKKDGFILLGVLPVPAAKEEPISEPAACDCGLDSPDKEAASRANRKYKGKHGPKCAFKRSLKLRPQKKLARVNDRICVVHRVYVQGLCPLCMKEIADAKIKAVGASGDGQDGAPAATAGEGTSNGETQPDSVPDLHAGSEVRGPVEGEAESCRTPVPPHDTLDLLQPAWSETGPDCKT